MGGVGSGWGGRSGEWEKALIIESDPRNLRGPQQIQDNNFFEGPLGVFMVIRDPEDDYGQKNS